MTGSRPVAPLLVLLFLLTLSTAAVSAPRAIGVIADASPATHPIPFIRFADLLIEALAGSRQWEPTALAESSPLVRVSGATWPLPTRHDWMTVADVLRALLLATELDDLLVVRPIPAASNDLEVFWLRQGDKDIRRLHLSEPGSGDQAYAALSRKLLAQLEAGPDKAPVATRLAVAPPATPTTPPPAAPASPATGVTPATGTAVDVGGHTTPGTTAPATAPAAPTAPSTTGELPKPGTGEARPGAEAPRPETPPVQPAGAPVGPAAPVTPPATTEKPIPVTPPATPPATTEKPVPGALPAAPAGETPPLEEKPKEPSQYLTAARKYLKEGDFERVEEMLVKAQTAGDPKGQVFAAWAELEKARQNPTAERTWLERALREDDSLIPAHLRLAELLRQAGLWRKASDEYQIVIKREPANLYAYTGLSALYASQSQPRRAAEILTDALKVAPQDASLYLRIGDLHVQRQAWADAENAFDRAARLTAGPARGEALDRLGDLYLAVGRAREGFICYAEASKLRAGGASSMAEKRYQQIMQAADNTLLESAGRAQAALEAYLSGRSVYREEAWAAFKDFRQQVQEVQGFVGSIVPPTTMKTAHLERKLAYSLAAEAALAGLDYLDLGSSRQERLQDYRRLTDEAVNTIRKR